MAITAQQVNELRKKTGAGMMDCKKALIETDGDLEKAVELIREYEENKGKLLKKEMSSFGFLSPVTEFFSNIIAVYIFDSQGFFILQI